MMRIVLIGTGNLATRLGIALRAKNADIIQIFGRSAMDTRQFAAQLGCPYTTNKKHLVKDADIYILAVSDDAIADLAAELPLRNQLIVHTAGSVSMEVLASTTKNYGVFYPVQTFSRQKEVDFSRVPVCIEANSPGNLEKLRTLAETISDLVVMKDSLQRKQLHLAAVFVCNFVNHFYSIGNVLLVEQNLDFNLLKPLISETAEKVMQFQPHEVQTGPAIRGNLAVMESHLKMLEQHPEWQKIYELMSRDISRQDGRPGQGR